MIAVNYTEFRNQMKNHLDLVTLAVIIMMIIKSV